MCGIERLWVHRAARRQGVATKLLDYICGSYVFAYKMGLGDIAFSQPTPDGQAFATKYTRRNDYLVYP